MDCAAEGHRFLRGPILLRTWLFTVLINIAKRRGMRERRDADMTVMAFTGGTVDPSRFRDGDDPYPGHWRPDEAPPSPFPDTPEALCSVRN